MNQGRWWPTDMPFTAISPRKSFKIKVWNQARWSLCILFAAGRCCGAAIPNHGTLLRLPTEDDTGYKEEQELFVSGLTGTSMMELSLVGTTIPAGLWVLGETKALLQVICGDDILQPRSWVAFAIELLCVVFPGLLVTTWTPSTLLVAFMALTSLLCSLIRRGLQQYAMLRGEPSHESFPRCGEVKEDKWRQDRDKALLGVRKDFVTNYRATVMILTCISILAVDFQVFPRRFAKTEVYGTGLMDLGVGATLFASGIANACKEARTSDGKVTWLPSPRALFVDLTSTIRSSWLLVVLGVSRFVAIKALNYQEHVSEYGIHWNFFATLVSVRLVAVVARSVCPKQLRAPLSLAGLVYFQHLLCHDKLGDFIISSPRRTFLGKNREGILGLVGFVAIYFVAEELGRLVMFNKFMGMEVRVQGAIHQLMLRRSQKWYLTRLLLSGAVLWSLTLLSRSYVQDTSRRLVNLTYVLWVCAYSATMLVQLLLVDMYSSAPPRSQLLAAVNRNMFTVFVASNLITGAVNLCMRTLYASDTTAMVILSTYMVIVMSLTLFLANKGNKEKRTS
ncbi:unnamed protein product [Discosporangium mesarthrocarpum]